MSGDFILELICLILDFLDVIIEGETGRHYFMTQRRKQKRAIRLSRLTNSQRRVNVSKEKFILKTAYDKNIVSKESYDETINLLDKELLEMKLNENDIVEPEKEKIEFILSEEFTNNKMINEILTDMFSNNEKRRELINRLYKQGKITTAKYNETLKKLDELESLDNKMV